MSHVVQADGVINNLAALNMACERLGLTMTEGEEFYYEGRQRHHGARYVIRKPGLDTGSSYMPREIGVMPDKEPGVFALAMSTMGGGICDVVGDPLNKNRKTILAPTLLQTYQMCNVALAARAQGHDVSFYMEEGAQKARVTQPQYA